MTNETETKLFAMLTQEFNIIPLQTDMQEIENIICGDNLSLIELERERLAWSLETFPEATPLSSIYKLESEIKEIKENIANGVKDPIEYADAVMCVFDSAGRDGITPEEILKAYAQKLAINKARKWVKNPDNSYSHVKQ